MTRRIGSTAIALAIVLLMLLSLHAPPASRAATPGVYIALGDSIAAGVGSSLPRERGNAALVADWLARLSGESVPHENLAVPGETAASFVTDGQLDRLRDTVARSRAAGIPLAAVTVSLGGNEMLDLEETGLSDRQAGLDAFRTSFSDAISAIRTEVGGETPLVASTYYDLSEGDATIQFSDAWWIEQFNEVIRSVAAEHDALIADVATRFAGNIAGLTHNPYDVHPNNAGHLAIAQTIWATLEFDNEPPAIEVMSDTDATRQTPTIQFTAGDNVEVSSIAAFSDDAKLHGPFQIGDDAYAVLLDLTTTDREEVAFTVEISDDAGNTTRQEVMVRMNVVDRGESQ